MVRKVYIIVRKVYIIISHFLFMNCSLLQYSTVEKGSHTNFVLYREAFSFIQSVHFLGFYYVLQRKDKEGSFFCTYPQNTSTICEEPALVTFSWEAKQYLDLLAFSLCKYKTLNLS